MADVSENRDGDPPTCPHCGARLTRRRTDASDASSTQNKQSVSRAIWPRGC